MFGPEIKLSTEAFERMVNKYHDRLASAEYFTEEKKNEYDEVIGLTPRQIFIFK